MALKDAKTDVTAPVIDDILHDLRLARLFTDKDLCCALQLWVLHVKAETAVENRLVYGRLIPYNHASGTWSASDREDLSPVGDLQIQVARLNLYLHAHQCGGLLRSLSECRTLEEISEQMGISENTSKSQFMKARAYLRKQLPKEAADIYGDGTEG